ncbi:hypothetical protein [Streptomyces griseosporeus]
MSVAVDQSGQGDLAAAVDALGGGDPGRLGGRHDGLDGPVADDHGGVLAEADPFLLVVDEDGAPGDEEIGVGGRPCIRPRRGRHRPNVRRCRRSG